MEKVVDVGFTAWASLPNPWWTQWFLWDKNLVSLIKEWMTYTVRDEVMRHAREIMKASNLDSKFRLMNRISFEQCLYQTLDKLHRISPDNKTVVVESTPVRRSCRTTLLHVLALAEESAGFVTSIHWVCPLSRFTQDDAEKHDKMRLKDSPRRIIYDDVELAVINKTGLIFMDDVKIHDHQTPRRYVFVARVTRMPTPTA